jgi:hypothetical protein
VLPALSVEPHLPPNETTGVFSKEKTYCSIAPSPAVKPSITGQIIQVSGEVMLASHPFEVASIAIVGLIALALGGATIFKAKNTNKDKDPTTQNDFILLNTIA